MAQRRMMSKQIVDGDDFLDMPLSAQALYLHLLVRADDEGFINGVKKVMRMIGARDDDLNILIHKRFALIFDSGVLVIKHWLIHNSIRKDRFKVTTHQEERNLLDVKVNDSYTLKDNVTQLDNGVVTVWQPNGNQMAPQVSIGKVSIGKVNKEKKEPKTTSRFSKPSVIEIKEYCKERNNSINAEAFYDFYESKNWLIGKNKMKDWKAAVRTWERRDSKQSSNNDVEDYLFGGTK